MQPTDVVIRIAATRVCGSEPWPCRGADPITRPTPPT
jgi:threonine dehydrogenase-like Zn-dependent dehydrogenase